MHDARDSRWCKVYKALYQNTRSCWFAPLRRPSTAIMDIRLFDYTLLIINMLRVGVVEMSYQQVTRKWVKNNQAQNA